MTTTTDTRHRITVGRPAQVVRGHLPQGEPEGTPDRITVTNRSLERDGRPFLPAMGEYHYARSPRDRWREELLTMRAGGITVVATYVFWILHEEHEGDFDWRGDRDLRAFVETCAELGLDAVVRIGPWGHGEARHGGFPNWVVDRHGTRARTDDAAYLADVDRFLAEIAAQLDGLYHRSGGPIIGIQLENELYDQPGHLRTLRRTAERLGMAPAFWTATGWGGAVLPRGEVLPVYAGYSDVFWTEWSDGFPESSLLHYVFSDVRDDLSVGADVRAVGGSSTTVVSGAADSVPDDALYPYATCELAGGMHTAYHRRPLVAPEDVAAIALTKLGSGSSWQGYYMYHGGSQALVSDGRTQESHATGYPNDVPQISYDFDAPIGESGQVRPHFHLLRTQHLFIAAFGPLLAPMPLTLPAVLPASPDDRDTLRWSVRSDGDVAFLFVNTHQPAVVPLPGHEQVQFEVVLPERTVTVPTAPVSVPAGSSFVWPIRLGLGNGVVLRSATAQPVTVLEDADGTPTTVLLAQRGIAVEVVLDGVDGVRLDGRDVPDDLVDGALRVLVPAAGGTVRALGSGGAAQVLVLPVEDRNRVTTATIAGRTRLIRTAGVVLDHPLDGSSVRIDGDVADRSVAVWPADDVDEPTFADAPADETDGGGHRVWTLPVGRPDTDVPFEEVRPARVDALPPVVTGALDRASVPVEAAWDAAARVRIDTATVWDDPTMHRAFLRVDWAGDVLRLVVDGAVVADQFFSGAPFEVDLTRWAPTTSVELRILPWRGGAPVYLDPAVRDRVRHGSADVSSVRLRTEQLHPAWR